MPAEQKRYSRAHQRLMFTLKNTIRSQYGAEKYLTHRVILIQNFSSKCGVFSRFNYRHRPFKTGVMTFYKFGVTLAKLMFTKNIISLAIHCQEILGTW